MLARPKARRREGSVCQIDLAVNVCRIEAGKSVNDPHQIARAVDDWASTIVAATRRVHVGTGALARPVERSSTSGAIAGGRCGASLRRADEGVRPYVDVLILPGSVFRFARCISKTPKTFRRSLQEDSRLTIEKVTR